MEGPPQSILLKLQSCFCDSSCDCQACNEICAALSPALTQAQEIPLICCWHSTPCYTSPTAAMVKMWCHYYNIIHWSSSSVFFFKLVFVCSWDDRDLSPTLCTVLHREKKMWRKYKQQTIRHPTPNLSGEYVIHLSRVWQWQGLEECKR